MGNCLDDLDEPLECIPGPTREGAAIGCVTLLSEGLDSFDAAGCVDEPDALACYRDPARGCSCDPAECFDDGAASCHPPPDCPSEVAALYPEAECVRFAAEDVGPFVDEREQCLCGCEQCIRVCDGKGPVWSQIDLDAAHYEAGTLLLDLQRQIPRSGRLGVYVRARGVSLTPATPGMAAVPPRLYLFAGAVSDPPELLGELPAIMGDRFESAIFPDGELRALDSSEPAPLLLALGNEPGYFSLYELDCVVPFVVP